jgi:hypothetical protein
MPRASQSIKISFAIALLIGLAIAGIFAIIDPYTGFYFLNWQLPGSAAAYVYWGAFGGSTAGGLVIMWLANGLMYSVPALFVIRSIVALRSAR